MNPEQLYDQAQTLLSKNQHNEAYKILKKLDAGIPNHPGILYFLAACQSLTGNKLNAVRTYERVLRIKPDFVEAMNNLGLDLKNLGRLRDALAYFEKALHLQPSFFDAKLNKATVLLALHEDQEASNLLVQLLKIAPDHPMVLANLGSAHLKTQDPRAALEHFQEARKLLANNLEITRGYIASIAALKDWKALIDEEKNLPLNLLNDPQIKDLVFKAFLNTCEWQSVNSLISQAKEFSSPLNSLCVIEDAQCLKDNIIQWSNINTKTHGEIKFLHENKKIRVGYISPDFRSHPISYLTKTIFDHHDPSGFEIHGISIDRFPPANDPYREHIAKACHEFHEFGNLDDNALITQLRKLNFDVLIDLCGHTNDSRTCFLAARCAPIQIQYLGFPGTMGTSYIDYTIGDPIITPKTHLINYTEKIISLPECFQANDDQRAIAATASRHLFNLPEASFVFACFNQQIKFTAKIFDSWIRALRSVPNSILWLAKANSIQVNNLKSYAKSHGIEPERLIFAERIPYEQHLGRYAFVDLVLDTFPFNGGTTTSDALWGGAPVVTIAGDSYSSRMSASLLHSVGLDELITQNLSDYETLAIKLASESEYLGSLRNRLKSALGTAPAFNTKRFVKHLEIGLRMAMDRHNNKLNPESLFVPLFDC